MPKLYALRALDDLQGVKTYIAKQFGEAKVKKEKITGATRAENNYCCVFQGYPL